jgi:hypothetical protein
MRSTPPAAGVAAIAAAFILAGCSRAAPAASTTPAAHDSARPTASATAPPAGASDPCSVSITGPVVEDGTASATVTTVCATSSRDAGSIGYTVAPAGTPTTLVSAWRTIGADHEYTAPDGLPPSATVSAPCVSGTELVLVAVTESGVDPVHNTESGIVTC